MGQNIFYDDPLGALQGATTGSAAVHGAEMVEKLVPEAALCHDLQRLSSLIVELNISEVRALQCDGGIEDLFQQRMEFSLTQQACAQLMETVHRRQLGDQFAGVRDGRGHLTRNQFAEVQITFIEVEA
jgi:hypothetical protein